MQENQFIFYIPKRKTSNNIPFYNILKCIFDEKTNEIVKEEIFINSPYHTSIFRGIVKNYLIFEVIKLHHHPLNDIKNNNKKKKNNFEQSFIWWIFILGNSF